METKNRIREKRGKCYDGTRLMYEYTYRRSSAWKEVLFSVISSDFLGRILISRHSMDVTDVASSIVRPSISSQQSVFVLLSPTVTTMKAVTVV